MTCKVRLQSLNGTEAAVLFKVSGTFTPVVLSCLSLASAGLSGLVSLGAWDWLRLGLSLGFVKYSTDDALPCFARSAVKTSTFANFELFLPSLLKNQVLSVSVVLPFCDPTVAFSDLNPVSVLVEVVFMKEALVPGVRGTRGLLQSCSSLLSPHESQPSQTRAAGMHLLFLQYGYMLSIEISNWVSSVMEINPEIIAL